MHLRPTSKLGYLSFNKSDISDMKCYGFIVPAVIYGIYKYVNVSLNARFIRIF